MVKEALHAPRISPELVDGMHIYPLALPIYLALILFLNDRTHRWSHHLGNVGIRAVAKLKDNNLIFVIPLSFLTTHKNSILLLFDNTIE